MNNELYHFNHNHDKLGRFTFTRGGSSGGSLRSKISEKKKEKEKKNLSKAAEQANKEADFQDQNAKYYDSGTNDYRKRYVDHPKGRENWLRDMYGNDYKNASYMKKYFGINDVYKHAEKEIKREYEETKKSNKEVSDFYRSEANRYRKIAEKYANALSYKDLDRRELAEAKKYIEKYLKEEKHQARINKNKKSKEEESS